MKTHQIAPVGVVIAMLLLAACGPADPAAPTVTGRWYSADQVEQGAGLFQTHCASCHGENAEGLADDWRKTDSNGNYPPPPLNGSAHAWHHPLAQLKQTIAEGGVPYKGLMPGFASTLSDDEADAIIAHFQNYWPDETYRKWREIDQRQ